MPALAEGVSDPILAEKVSPSQLTSGDRIVIVYESREMALTQTALTNARLSGGQVTIDDTATRRVLTSLPEDTAIFELTALEDGWLLRCEAGYLTSSPTGNALSLTSEYQDGSRWQFKDDLFLYNPSAAYTSGSYTYRNYYLEFFSTYFTLYGKRNGADPAPFTMAFYRLGNSLPEEPLLRESWYSLPLLYTSDVHGYLANVTEAGDTQYLLAYIADRVNDSRRQGRDRSILLDGGDIFQGTTLSNLVHGQSLSAAYAMMGYDAVALGNHEFDWGLETTVDSDGTMMDYDLGEDYQGVNHIPVLISNLYQNGSKVSWGRDYIILNKTAVDAEGHELAVRVAVIGLAGNYGSSILSEHFGGAGYSILLDYGEVNDLAARLESENLCDATVLLAHESAETIADGLGADTVIDLVLGGHTHMNVCRATAGGLRYIEPSCYSKAYGRVDLAFTVEDGAPRFFRTDSASVISVPALTNTEDNAGRLDQEIVALTDYAVSLISEFLDVSVGSISVSALRNVYLPGSGNRSTTCGNWMSSIIARMYDADIGFVNSGGLRVDFPVESGKDSRAITRSDVYTMFPFDNRVYLFDLTWEDLLGALEYSLTTDGKRLLSEISGMTCYYENGTVTALVNDDGVPVYVDGYWLNDWRTRHITVAASEYIVTTDRPSEGLSNPFVIWNDTERLLAFDKVDNVAATEVLEEEAKNNDGMLAIDPLPHFINASLAPWEGQAGLYSLPEGVTTVDEEAFAGCGVQVLRLPDTCASIQSGAFRDCPLLREVWLPPNCTVAPTAFENCPSLTSVYHKGNVE